MSELMFTPALELAALVRDGQLTARELVEQCLRRIEELEPTINAFTYVAHAEALDAAAKIEPGDQRPFAGVPIAIKDNRPVAGMPITMGSDLFGNLVARHDACLVRRLKDAGFVVVGKTVLPEMGILPTTEPRRFGAVHNPWALDRTTGGSSGGAAAAVAAGMVPIAHGNDGGGSIRIPAACCGLVGLKPARGRISQGPDIGQSFLTSDGVLTRTVADTAAVLDVLAGYELGDSTWAPPPSSGFEQAASIEPARLKVAVALDPPLEGVTLDPTCAQAVRDTAAALTSLGHDVEEITPPWSKLDLLSDFTRMFGPMVSLTTLIGGKIAGREVTEDDVEPLTWALWERARAQDALTFLSAQTRTEATARKLIAFFDPYDIVITPALAQRPVRIGAIHGRGPEPWEHFRRSGYFTPYTGTFNLLGVPAASLPLHHGDDGLPTGVQLIARPIGEALLLALSSQLEQALPWATRRPPVDDMVAAAGAGQ
jgi:amidase